MYHPRVSDQRIQTTHDRTGIFSQSFAENRIPILKVNLCSLVLVDFEPLDIPIFMNTNKNRNILRTNQPNNNLSVMDYEYMRIYILP